MIGRISRPAAVDRVHPYFVLDVQLFLRAATKVNVGGSTATQQSGPRPLVRRLKCQLDTNTTAAQRRMLCDNGELQCLAEPESSPSLVGDTCAVRRQPRAAPADS